MEVCERVEAFAALGCALEEISEGELSAVLKECHAENPWFTRSSVLHALTGIRFMLSGENLKAWVGRYDFPVVAAGKRIGVITPGNLPLVGFQDILSILIAGHKALVKPSSRNSVLFGAVVRRLGEINPKLGSNVEWCRDLKHLDALVASGADRTLKLLEFDFQPTPMLLRGSSVSVAVLDGKETRQDLEGLGDDIFKYFGMGCRSVKMIFIPRGYDLGRLQACWERGEEAFKHEKYRSNYTYQKALLLTEGREFEEVGSILLRESSDLFAPLSVVHYQEYGELGDLQERLKALGSSLQVVVSNQSFPAGVGFGKTQLPRPWDYPDAADTIDFLLRL